MANDCCLLIFFFARERERGRECGHCSLLGSIRVHAFLVFQFFCIASPCARACCELYAQLIYISCAGAIFYLFVSTLLFSGRNVCYVPPADFAHTISNAPMRGGHGTRVATRIIACSTPTCRSPMALHSEKNSVNACAWKEQNCRIEQKKSENAEQRIWKQTKWTKQKKP